MRKYRKWVVTLGLIAAAPNVGLAGPFDFLQGEPKAPKAQADGATNQQIAEAVARQLKKTDLKGASVEIEFQDGILTLMGQAPDAQTVAVINHAASTVKGVQQINNEMTVGKADDAKSAEPTPNAAQNVRSAAYEARPGKKSQIRPAGNVASPAANGQMLRRGPVAPVNYMQETTPPAPPAAMPPGAPPRPAGPPMAPGYPAQSPYPGAAVPPASVPPGPPAWAHGGAAATGAVYDQPALPNYAWPSYSAYPNYAALTYPKQYSASAWPYIGPYYPYPQVPLGWREVSLEWDDGHWFLDFNDRTDRWWWFMNPKKW